MGTYKNIMELLVEEEVIRQSNALPARAASYLNTEELIAYALNQLPPLYATSEQGLEYQIQRGKVKFAPQITQAVQRAIAAVRRDPLRRNTPLKQNQASPLNSPLNNVLQQVRQLLKDDDIQWETLPSAIEGAVKRAAYRAAQAGSTRSDYAVETGNSQRASENRSKGSRSPQTGMASAGIRPVANPRPAAKPSDSDASVKPAAREAEYGWDDPLYFSR